MTLEDDVVEQEQGAERRTEREEQEMKFVIGASLVLS